MTNQKRAAEGHGAYIAAIRAYAKEFADNGPLSPPRSSAP